MPKRKIQAMDDPPTTPGGLKPLLSLNGRRILVTGASGFIGSHLARTLESRGATVTRVSRRTGVDAADADALDCAVANARPDSIFHLASSVTASHDLSLVLPTLRNNFLSTVHVLLAAHRHNVRRVIQIGSLQEPLESAGETANSPYAASKAAATAYARMFASLYGLSVTVARVFVVYGPCQQDLTKVLPHTITRVLAGGPVELSSARQPFDWIHVRDVVDALTTILDRTDLDGEVVDVGSGELVSVASVVQAAAEFAGAPELLRFGVLPDRKGDPVRTADVERTFRLTGWKPAIGLRQGLSETVDSYRVRPEVVLAA